MVNIRRSTGQIETPNLIALILFAGLILFNLGNIKTFFVGYQPKNLPVISADDLTQIMSPHSTKPTLVYFYHKITDTTARQYLPVLDEFALKYGDRLDFVRYPLSDYGPEKFKEYWQMESQMAVFKDGQKFSSSPAFSTDMRSVTRGFVFKTIREWVMPRAAPASPENRKDWFVHANEFESLVLNARRPVIVDFTCKTCPAAQMLEPQFKQIAAANSAMAEFYLCDTRDPDNGDIIWKYGSTATPTLALFYDGKRREKISGASSEFIGNEAIILGMISNYYY